MVTHPTWDKDAQWVRVYRARIRLGLERCRLCGCRHKFGTDRQLTLDHIWPRSKGYGSEMANCTILCIVCNNAKAADAPVHKVSLMAEEKAAPRAERWSLRGVPEVPDELLVSPLLRWQPPRTARGRRRALRRALPSWAPSEWADVPPGEPVPDYVLTSIRVHNGEVPAYIQAMLLVG